MRPSLVVSLLLLSLLLSEVCEGIRLDKGFMSSVGQQQIVHEDKSDLIKKTEAGSLGEVILCKDGHCSGKTRKLVTTSTSSTTTTTTTSKNEKNEENKAEPTSKGKKGFGEEEDFTVNTRPTSSHDHRGEVAYTDITDLAEMDYSPAKRKPPIHN